MMFVVGVLGILVALLIPKAGGAFAFALEYYSLTAAFSMPVALGMIYTRTPWWSGIASCSAAIAVALALMFAGVWNEHAFARNMISESVVAGVVFFGSAFFFRQGGCAQRACARARTRSSATGPRRRPSGSTRAASMSTGCSGGSAWCSEVC